MREFFAKALKILVDLNHNSLKTSKCQVSFCQNDKYFEKGKMDRRIIEKHYKYCINCINWTLCLERNVILTFCTATLGC